MNCTEHGNWYFPDGTVVLETLGDNDFMSRLQVNRGPNEVINGQTVYGSVRLFQRFSILHQEEVVFAVSYPMILIPVLTRTSMLTFVS